MNERFADVPKQIAKLQNQMNSLKFGQSLSIVFAPNLLQLKYLADFALTDDTLYVISGVFSPKAVIHEYLHVVLEPRRPLFTDIVRRYGIEAFVDVEKMIALGYMRDQAESSQIHALEDCIIRALCGILEASSDVEYCRMNEESGFLSVGKMINGMQNVLLENITLEQIILKMASFVCQNK